MMRCSFWCIFMVMSTAFSASGVDTIRVRGEKAIEVDHTRMELRAFKNASLKRGETQLFGDAIYAFYEKAGKTYAFTAAEAYGRVKAVAPDKIIEAREARYDMKKDEIYFRGDVHITKGNHYLQGAYAIMNRKSGRTVFVNYDPLAQNVKTLGNQVPQQVHILLNAE